MLRSLAAIAFAAILLAAPGAKAQEDPGEAGVVELGTPVAAPPPCGTQPVAIARMGWPSAQILAEIHARILAQSFGCVVRVVPGDLAATASTMGSTGQPAVAPEMWIARVPDIWNAGIKALKVRPAGQTYGGETLEGWFVPDYTAAAHPELVEATAIAAGIAGLSVDGARPQFVSCPPDWACAVINRNLIAALGLTALLDIVEPANRFEMDRLIADAVSRKEPILFYYWQPNPVLNQFAFKPVALGTFDPEAFACLGRRICSVPKPSAFAPEPVVVAVADWLYADAPQVAAYLQRAAMPPALMNALLGQFGEPGATAETVADRFITEHPDVWQPWVGAPEAATP